MFKPIAMAVGAHPDDIEFHMAGTLLLLKSAGWETHYLNLASGNCGSSHTDGPTTRLIRHREARAAAKALGAHFHQGFTDDLEIGYNLKLLRQVSAVIRDVQPSILLTHSPQDYMEDHTATSRLAVSAAFARSMPNFKTSPPRGAIEGGIAVYHAMPHGLRDPLRAFIVPGAFVNTTSVHQLKLQALACHRSQQKWLDTSQGFNSYLLAMEQMALQLGRMSRKFKHAEGWRRHSHLGFSPEDTDPLAAALGKNYLVNRAYERQLKKGA